MVFADAVKVFDVAGAAEQLHKVLVVGDYQQLEVALARATFYNSRESKQDQRR